MGWNHRVLASEHKGEKYFQIHEVYYDKEGTPNSYTTNPIPVSGESLENIEWVLNKMKECIKKPILWSGDKFPQEYRE